MKHTKTLSLDGISSELIKDDEFHLDCCICIICTVVRATREQESCEMFVAIKLKDNLIRSDPDNYRGIHLFNTARKVYSKMINKGLSTISDLILSNAQTSFREGRVCNYVLP